MKNKEIKDEVIDMFENYFKNIENNYGEINHDTIDYLRKRVKTEIDEIPNKEISSDFQKEFISF